MDDHRILTESDARNLQAHGLASPPDSDGYVRVHKRRLHSSSDEENHDLPLPSPGSTVPDDAFTNIPMNLISYATLEYVGFSPEKAAEIWQKWTNWDIGDPPIPREVDVDNTYGGLIMTFYDFFTGPVSRVNGRPDTASEDDTEWTRCMDAYGLSSELQQAMLDPLFRKIRLSESCLYWTRDTIDMRYKGLLSIKEASIERSRAQQRQAFRDAHHSSRESTQQASRSVSSELRDQVPGLQVFDSLTDMRHWAAARAPGHTVLWKGIDTQKINGLLSADGHLQKIGKLLSHFPGDFTRKNRVSFYFSPTYEVAEYYAGWAKRRSETNTASIVRIELLNRDIESLQEPDIQRIYWPDEDWKRLVWQNRRAEKPSRDLAKFSAATLVIGSTAKGPNSNFEALDSPDDIRDQDILRLSRDNVQPRGEVQWAFQDDHGEEWLAQNIKKITVSAFSKNVFNDWVSEESASEDS